MAISVRGSAIQHINNASSAAIAFPAGSAAGDRCVIAVGHGFAVNLPSGWTSIDSATGTNVNGAAFEKILTSGDISTGSVTVSFTGTYYGHAGVVTFVGHAQWMRTKVSLRSSSGAGPRTIVTDTTPISTDYVIHFGQIRLNNTITISRGSTLQSNSNTNSSGKLNSETLGASGSISTTFTYGATPTGDYCISIVYAEDLGTTQAKVSQLGRLALLTSAAPVKSLQLARPVLLTPDTPAKSLQLARLVLYTTAIETQVQVRQLVRMVLYSPPRGSRRMSLM